MSEKTFNKGDTVYSIDGQQGEYLMAYEDAHLVLPHFRDDGYDDGGPYNEHPWPGEPTVWHEVFTKPPIPVVHEEVAAARVELDAVQKEVREAEQQLRTMQQERLQLQRDQSAVRARLQENEALRNIDAYLAGSITHFVVDVNYVPSIETAQATLEHRDGYRKSIRLLGLFGDEERGVRWKVCTYGDGSGSMQEVIPCLSLEEAQERARSILINTTLPAIRSGKLDSDYYGRHAVKLAGELGVKVPQDVATKVAAQHKATAQRVLEQTRKEADRHAENLRKAEAEAIAAGVEITSGSAA